MKLRLLLLVAVLASGCGGWSTTPYPARTPAPLPQGATSLRIDTAPAAAPGSPGADMCPDALLEPVELVRDGDGLTFLLVDTKMERPIIWPRGFSAWLRDGRAELVAPDGEVIASEGDVLQGTIGGAGPLPGAFVVCTVGKTGYGPAS